MNGLDVKELREKIGATQKELAQTLGVSYRTIQNWEAGSVIPTSKDALLRRLFERVDTLENQTVRERIRLIISSTGLNDNAFAKKINITQSVIASMFRRETEPSVKIIICILKTFPNISAEWLMRGTGDMLLKGDKEKTEVNSHNKNTNINDSETIGKLLAMLEEKDKQINQLLEIIKTK